MLDLTALPPARLPFPVTRALAETVQTEGDTPTMVGHFSTFNDWYEVDSHIEGHFLERVAPGAFRKTIAESRNSMKVLFNHGQDSTMGNQIMGGIEELREDTIGPAYTVPLFAGVPPLIVSGLRAGAYGSSHRFSAEKDVWDYSPKPSTWNPSGIPERTITEARVYEFGPVTFPADPKATAGLRSTTDLFYQRSKDPESLETLLRSAQVARTPARAEAAPQPDEPPSDTPLEPPATDTPTVVKPAEPADNPEPQETRTVEYNTREDKAARLSELKDALGRQAVEYPGVLPTEAQATWDRDTAEVTGLEADIRAWDERTALLRSFAAEPSKTVTGSYSAPQVIVRKTDGDIYDLGEARSRSRSDTEFTQNLRDNAMRSLETSVFAHPDVDEDATKTHLARMIDHKDSADNELKVRMLQTGSPGYRRAFNKLVTGRPLTPEEQRYAALEVVGTTTTGGYAIPYVFDPTFIPTGAFTNINPYRQICRVEQIVGGNNWQGVSVGAVLSQYDDESAAVTEGGPTFARPSFTAQRATAFVSLSRETMQDRPDIGSELAVLIGESKDTLEENQFSIGVGSTVYPLGVGVKSTYTVKETITDNVFAVADLDATEAALPIRHRRNAVWMYARGVIRIIQGWETAYGKLFNSTLGYPAVGNPANNPGGNTGLNLIGYPIWETPSMPVTVTSDDTIVGLLFDPKSYLILDRVGMEVEIIPNLVNSDGLPTGQRGVLALWRNTAGPVNADAGRQVNIN